MANTIVSNFEFVYQRVCGAPAEEEGGSQGNCVQPRLRVTPTRDPSLSLMSMLLLSILFSLESINRGKKSTGENTHDESR